MAVRYDGTRKQWYIEFEQAGIRVHKRLPKGCTRAQAEAKEGQLRREIYDREELHKLPDLTIGEAIDIWLKDNRRKNQRQAESEARQWEPWRGKLLREAPEVAAQAVTSWSALRIVKLDTTPSSTGYVVGARTVQTPIATKRGKSTSAPSKSSTINRRLMLLKAVCKSMWRKKLHPENLSGRIQTLREPPHKDVYLTPVQVKSLASCCPTTESTVAVTLLAYTGLRASELLNATYSPTAGLTVAQSKTGKPRVVPLPGAVRQLSRHLPLGLSYWELRKQFIAARKKAKLPPTVTLHTLRHTCASWLINAGVDLYTVGKILGHTSPQTTQRYAHLATSTLEKAMARLR